jgi:putative peptidoglycan lipid II flippase
VTGTQAPATQAGRARPATRAIGRAALAVGAITVVSNIIGFGRQLVFAHTVAATCLGTAYVTANQVPNIIYDVVIGGALSSALVPVLAGPAARRLDRAAGSPGPAAGAPGPAAGAPGPAAGAPGPAAEPGGGAGAEASRITSALLTWTVLLLAPASVIIALAAGPLASALLAGAPHCDHAPIVAASSRMLVVFAPQIVLYGLAVVLYGVLQAHRRFIGPAVAPVLSSVVVITAYLAFVPLSHGARNHLATLPGPAALMLSLGTTAGVAALALTALGPALRLGLRVRPTLRFPPGVARRIRGLAAVGVAALLAQDASVVVVMVLANGHQGHGGLVLYNFGWQMFFVPYAVLAVPIATTTFPVLSAAGDTPFSKAAFNETAAAATRAVMLACWLGAALLAGAAVPAARLFAHRPAEARTLALTFVAFAPGLIGYGLATCLSRVLFAGGRAAPAAGALVAGWLLVIAADVTAVALVPGRWVIPVLGLGNSVGLSAAGLALLAVVRGVRGRAALHGTARAALAGLTGAVAGVAAGLAVSSAAPPSAGFAVNAVITVLTCACVLVVFAVAALALAGGDLRAVAGRVRARLPGPVR